MKSWQVPVLMAGLLFAVALSFAAGAPGLGISMLGLILVGGVILAFFAIPDDPIGKRPDESSLRRLLVVSDFAIEDPATIDRLVLETGLGSTESPLEVRILAPARSQFLDRWATDYRKAQERAQRDLVLSVASLTLTGVRAEAQVGDESLVQAVEDELATYPATEVILLTRSRDLDLEAADALRRRLRPPFRHLDLYEP
jgi:hypothetical protein